MGQAILEPAGDVTLQSHRLYLGGLGSIQPIVEIVQDLDRCCIAGRG